MYALLYIDDGWEDKCVRDICVLTHKRWQRISLSKGRSKNTGLLIELPNHQSEGSLNEPVLKSVLSKYIICCYAGMENYFCHQCSECAIVRNHAHP